MKRFILIICTLIVALAITPASAVMYKWVDEDGVVHYSDNPYTPPAKNAQIVPLPDIIIPELPVDEDEETDTLMEDIPYDAGTTSGIEADLPDPEYVPDEPDAGDVPDEFIDDTISETGSGRSLFASGYAEKEGKRMEFSSAAASLNKTKAELNVFVFPFELTNDEETDILEGDSNNILHAENLRDRQFEAEDFFFWLKIELNKVAGMPDTSSIKSYSFSFQYFDDKGTSTGCGEWVKEYSEFNNFQSTISNDGGAISFDFTSKAGIPFNWDIQFSVNTKIHKVY